MFQLLPSNVNAITFCLQEKLAGLVFLTSPVLILMHLYNLGFTLFAQSTLPVLAVWRKLEQGSKLANHNINSTDARRCSWQNAYYAIFSHAYGPQGRREATGR